MKPSRKTNKPKKPHKKKLAARVSWKPPENSIAAHGVQKPPKESGPLRCPMRIPRQFQEASEHGVAHCSCGSPVVKLELLVLAVHVGLKGRQWLAAEDAVQRLQAKGQGCWQTRNRVTSTTLLSFCGLQQQSWDACSP
jgi:hypothetical protein